MGTQKLYVLRSALLAVLALAVPALRAQTVSPVIVEEPELRDGRIDLGNESLEPLIVTLEAKSFTIDKTGTAAFVPLSSSIHLQLSETSLRIPPKQHRFVYYRASADAYPAWFCIYSSFAGLPRRNGMNLRLDLPHTVYLLGKNKPQKSDLRFADLHVEAGTVRGVLKNQGRNILRVQGLELVGIHGEQRGGEGFPLLPGGEHEFVIESKSTAPAKALRARVAQFSTEQPL